MFERIVLATDGSAYTANAIPGRVSVLMSPHNRWISCWICSSENSCLR
jgi:hypothetical protein